MTDMQPQNNEQHIGLEQLPMPPALNGERVPVLPAPEAGIETGAERREQTAEAHAAAADAAGIATGAAPVTVDPIVAPSPAPVSTSPLIAAADEDVIEKEWVDKAKQIVSATPDDPHSRSDQVSALQKEYLQKRFNKELGAQ